MKKLLLFIPLLVFSCMIHAQDQSSYKKGVANVNKGNLQVALTHFKEAIANAEDTEVIIYSKYYMAQIYYRIHELDSCIQFANSYITFNKNDASFYFLIGSAYGGTFKYEKAIEAYSRAIELNPKYKEAYTNRGLCKINQLSRQGNPVPAKEECVSACEDFWEAKNLGDKTVDDMIYVYCEPRDNSRKKRKRKRS